MKNVIEVLRANSLVVIFIIMYLEALNLTGIPAIVILPAVGVFIKNSGHSFLTVFIIASLASILGSLTYYLVSSRFGDSIYNFFYNKFPSTQNSLKKAREVAEKYGAKMCLIGRIIPTVRTFISLMAGIFKVRFKDYVIYSSLGILIWTLVLISLGYFGYIVSSMTFWKIALVIIDKI